MPQERLSRLHSSRKAQAAFLVNSYDLIVTTLNERGARADESSHFEQLLDSIKATFVEEQLSVDYGRLITYIKQTEPMLMQGASAADVALVSATMLPQMSATSSTDAGDRPIAAPRPHPLSRVRAQVHAQPPARRLARATDAVL